MKECFVCFIMVCFWDKIGICLHIKIQLQFPLLCIISWVLFSGLWIETNYQPKEHWWAITTNGEREVHTELNTLVTKASSLLRGTEILSKSNFNSHFWIAFILILSCNRELTRTKGKKTGARQECMLENFHLKEHFYIFFPK